MIWQRKRAVRHSKASRVRVREERERPRGGGVDERKGDGEGSRGSGDDERSEGMTIEGEIGKGDERSTCDLGQFQREFDLDDPKLWVQRGGKI